MSSTIETTPSAYGYPLLIKQLLHTPLAVAPDQEIVDRDRGRYTYRTLRERIGRLASGLASLGVGPGQTVAVMDWDSPRYLECFFAVPMMGAVLQTVNVRLSPEQIHHTLAHAGADVIVCHADFAPLVAALRPRLPTLRRVVLIKDGAPAPDLATDAEYEALLAGGSPAYAFPDFDENTRATTFYTTGTTGLPKGVYFSHRQLVLHTLAVATALGTAHAQGRVHREDVYMPLTPMFHVHAWGFPYIATLLGLKQVYPGRYLPDLICKLLRTEKVTLSHCVPTILQMVLASPEAQATDLRGWKVVIGGSALPKGLCTAALARGIDVFAGYGMSETAPVLTISHVPSSVPEDDLERQASIRTRTGTPIPLVDLRVVDPSLSDVPRDGRSTGEVVVRAPWLTQGYLHQPSESEALWAGGYLHTQDIGHLSPEGALQITDRLKDVIKTGGEWISSLELEDLLSRHPAVAEAAVIGVPDARWGERPLALVVLKAERQATTAEELKAHLRGFSDRGVISRYAVPDELRFVEALAKTSVGKLDKKALRAAHAGG